MKNGKFYAGPLLGPLTTPKSLNSNKYCELTMMGETAVVVSKNFIIHVLNSKGNPKKIIRTGI